MKSRGESFFPYAISKDVIAAAIVVGGLVALAAWVGVKTESMADPTSTDYNPRPEWYFLFLFQLLTYFPGWAEPIVAVIMPSVAILILLLLPFLDRNPSRLLKKRPVLAGMGVVVLIGIGYMTYEGAVMPRTNFPAEQSETIALGKRVYRELNCSYCHSIAGEGGAVGPDLAATGGQLDKKAIEDYFADPSAMVPHTLHPKLNFTPEEMQALTAYVLSLGAPIPYTKEAPVLFEKRCSICHTINGSGGRPGPDLSKVGRFRNQKWIEAFIRDPRAVVDSSSMPAFKDTLNPNEIEDLAAYLSNFRGLPTSPTPTPTPTPAPTPTVTPGPGPTLSPSPTAPPGPTPTPSPSPTATPGPGPSPTATPTVTVSPSPTPTPSPTTTRLPGVPPNIPKVHSTSGCPVCHSEGLGGAPKWPANHVGRTEAMCPACHQRTN